MKGTRDDQSKAASFLVMQDSLVQKFITNNKQPILVWSCCLDLHPDSLAVSITLLKGQELLVSKFRDLLDLNNILCDELSLLDLHC